MINTINQFTNQYPLVVSFVSAYLFYILSRSTDITILVKSEQQRTDTENQEIQNGLMRSIILDLLLFIPASIVLFWLIIFPLIIDQLLQIKNEQTLWYAFMGITGYGFPFATMRNFIKMIALRTLKDFHDISIKSDEAE